MIHPLAEDFDNLKDAEIESRIQDLTKKYFMTQNVAIQRQVGMFLDMYKAELQHRRSSAWQKEYQKRNKDLDNLINVS
jgi:hypothetical protein